MAKLRLRPAGRKERLNIGEERMSSRNPKIMGWQVILASWLAVFCLFGYRATFAILKGPMGITLGWSTSQVTLGYSLMMVFYAITAYFSGMILDKWGTKPVYAIAAVLGGLGFILTARVSTNLAYLFTFGFLGGVATGMLWVTSTVSVRKWYVGGTYATMWGFAFAGGPMAQFILAQVVKPVLSAAQGHLDATIKALIPDAAALQGRELAAAVAAKLKDPAVLALPEVRSAVDALNHAWRSEMTILGIIVLVALVVAVLVAKKSPEAYDLKPFGALPQAGAAAPAPEKDWGLGEAFGTYPIWGAILTFLGSVMAEFLIWTQVVSYWTSEVGFPLKKATSIYAFIGLVGIFSMPIMGKVADKVVVRTGNEALGRKIMLIIGPALGVVACLVLLGSGLNPALPYISCFIFAVYWAIVPGGVVGYTGAMYGRRTLGKIWGLATLIAMGVGPFTGSFMGGYLKDATGHYTASIWFALCSFVVSALFALSLPMPKRH
jgi:MFS family permease